MTDNTPPTTIFYAETGGKGAPFYRTLGGIKSALKTSWAGRWRVRALARNEDLPKYLEPPKVYRGIVTWEEIEL